MPDNELTELYLAEVAERGMGPRELVDAASREVDLAATTYFGRCLTRPVFLNQADHTQLAADLENLYRALTALPARLFGGDVGAFARAVGMAEAQVTAILRLQTDKPVMLARADLYPEPSGFRLMEVNMGSTVGGGDNAMLNRGMLAHPVLAEFVRDHSLTYVDTLTEVANTIMAECGVSPGDGSLIAAVDWPPDVEQFSAVLHTSAAEFKKLGLDLVPCHLGHLSLHDRRVWLGDRPDRCHLPRLPDRGPDASGWADPDRSGAARGRARRGEDLHPDGLPALRLQGRARAAVRRGEPAPVHPGRAGQPGPAAAVDPNGQARSGHRRRRAGGPAGIRPRQPGEPRPEAHRQARWPRRRGRLAHRRTKSGTVRCAPR